MPLRYRPMCTDDIAVLIDVVVHDPIMSPRYRGAEWILEAALLKLIGAEALLAVVFECAGERDGGLAGFGIRAFVSDDFARDATTPPFRWIGPDLADRVVRGEPAVLPNTELRHRNASGGLNAFVWMSWIDPRYRSRLDILNGFMTAFIENNRGYQIKELISQNELVESLETTVRAGGLILTEQGEYTDTSTRPATEVIMEPHCMRLTKNLALSRAASWVSTLFVYEPPRIFFSASEQRLLLAAMSGGTDDELAQLLRMSVSGVKKTWRQVYERAGRHRPDMAPTVDGGRGKGKKQRLLAYLREHPEELRPLPRRKHVARAH